MQDERINTTPDLNEVEFIVLLATEANSLYYSNGDFGYTDEIVKFAKDKRVTKQNISGYVSQLVQKEYLIVDPEGTFDHTLIAKAKFPALHENIALSL